jgi:hypothetical protein
MFKRGLGAFLDIKFFDLPAACLSPEVLTKGDDMILGGKGEGGELES